MADDLTAVIDRGLVLAALEMLAGQWDEVCRRAAAYAAQAGAGEVSAGACRARVERALGEALAAQRLAMTGGLVFGPDGSPVGSGPG